MTNPVKKEQVFLELALIICAVALSVLMYQVDGYKIVILNLFYLLTFPLVTLSAMFVLRQFGISQLSAIFAGVLYSVMPYHFVRGQHHLFLSAYFLVPLAVMVALWIATGKLALIDSASGKFRLNWREPKLLAAIARSADPISRSSIGFGAGIRIGRGFTRRGWAGVRPTA